MNIFFLSFDPRKAAQQHCDRHVVKMILESAQLLWTAWHVSMAGRGDDLLASAPPTLGGTRGYRPTHKNHPCAIWARETLANYRWLCALATELAAEYHYRYPSAGEHATEPHIRWLSAHPPLLPEKPLTWPALAMPEEYKISRNPTACYRAYYLGTKTGFLHYKRRDAPEWIVKNSNTRIQ
jgi:hypothetical protein